MRHRTKNLVERAASIADNEAEKVWRKTGDYEKWSTCWQEVYHNALLELCPQNV